MYMYISCASLYINIYIHTITHIFPLGLTPPPPVSGQPKNSRGEAAPRRQQKCSRQSGGGREGESGGGRCERRRRCERRCERRGGRCEWRFGGAGGRVVIWGHRHRGRCSSLFPPNCLGLTLTLTPPQGPPPPVDPIYIYIGYI